MTDCAKKLHKSPGCHVNLPEEELPDVGLTAIPRQHLMYFRTTYCFVAKRANFSSFEITHANLCFQPVIKSSNYNYLKKGQKTLQINLQLHLKILLYVSNIVAVSWGVRWSYCACSCATFLNPTHVHTNDCNNIITSLTYLLHLCTCSNHSPPPEFLNSTLMSSDQGERIQANRKLIQGDTDHDFGFEMNDQIHYKYVVRKDLGLQFGRRLFMTHRYPSIEAACAELDRMLAHMVAQAESEKPMSKQRWIEAIGVRTAEHVDVLSEFTADVEKRGGTRLRRNSCSLYTCAKGSNSFQGRT